MGTLFCCCCCYSEEDEKPLINADADECEPKELTMLKQFFSENIVSMKIFSGIHYTKRIRIMKDELVIVRTSMITSHLERRQTCVGYENILLETAPFYVFFIDNKNDEYDMTEYALQIIDCVHTKKYLKTIYPSLGNLYCVGINLYENKNKLTKLSETEDKCLLSMDLSIMGDIIHQFNINLLDFDEKQEPYEIHAWIEFENSKYNFKNVTAQKNTILDASNNLICMCLKNRINKRTLMIEIPTNKYHEWINNSISYRYIYVPSQIRHALILEENCNNKLYVYELNEN